MTNSNSSNGGLIHVKAYTRDDGTQVDEYWRNANGGRSFSSNGISNNIDVPNVVSKVLNTVGNSRGFEQECPALTKLFGTVSKASAEAPIPDPTVVLEGGIEVGRVILDRAIEVGKVVLEVLEEALPAAVAVAEGYLAAKVANSSIETQNNTLKTSLEGLRETQKLQQKNIGNLSKVVTNTKKKEEYSNLFKELSTLKTQYQQNERFIAKIEHSAQQRDYASVVDGLKKYSENQNVFIDDSTPEKSSNLNSFLGSPYSPPSEKTFSSENIIKTNNQTMTGGASNVQASSTLLNGKIEAMLDASQSSQATSIQEMHKQAEVYKQLCLIADDIIQGKTVKLPDGYTVLEKQYVKKTNFKAVAYQKGNQIIISYVGTDPTSLKDQAANLKMGVGNVTKQMRQANDFYIDILGNNKNIKICVTGHSEGGSEATYVGLKNHIKTYTYNSFPLSKGILSKIAETGGSSDYNNLIVNYRNAHDPISKLFYQNVGQIYIIQNSQNKFLATTPFCMKSAHSLINLDSCLNALPVDEFIKQNPRFIDSIKFVTFTNKTIKEITDAGLYDLYEAEIMERLKNNEIISESTAKEMAEQGKLAYMDGYYKKLT